MDTHRPEHGETVREYDTPQGKRLKIRFPSSSKAGAYHILNVNLDGTRPVCDCSAFKVAKYCYLTKHAEAVVQAHWERHYYEGDFDPVDLDNFDRRLLAKAEVPASERGPWMAAVALGFVKLEKFDRFWWFTLTDEAHKG